MKKQTMTVVFIGLVMMMSLALGGCSNSLAPSMQASSGAGNVTISFSASAGKAALSPATMNFDLYEFIFTRKSDNYEFTETRTPEQGFTFSLNVGVSYTLEVNAYVGSTDNRIPAAKSSAPVSFTVEPSMTVNVRLNGVLSEGEGTFTYSITYPENTKIEELILLVSGDHYEYLNIGAGETAISGSKKVPAGWYFLIVQLSMDNGSKVAGYANGVVINLGQTTDFTWEFAKVDFKSVNIGKPAQNWHGFVVDGSSSGFYSGAVGTLYDTFADKTGDDYTNVLKVEPPAGGYMPSTMALSYTVPESGDYKISMAIMVEEWPVEGIDIFWQQIDGNWATLAGGLSKIVGQAGQWFTIETIVPEGVSLGENQQIAILARQSGPNAGSPDNSTNNGLNDATIYIRDLKLEVNGSAVVNTSLPAGSVCGVTISPKNLDLFVGQESTLVFHVYPADASNKNVSWSSSDDAVATVDGGKVTTVGKGSATITVRTANGGFEASCVVTVTMPVSGVVLNKNELSLAVGENERLFATIYPEGATNQDLAWSSSDDAVATVVNGLVTAISKGTATITVRADGGDPAYCVVTVTVPVTGVTLDEATLALNKGNSKTLTVTVEPSDASNKNVIWTSSNTNAATVANGVVMAVGGGEATITVKTVDGDFEASCVVTVTVPVIEVSLNKTTLALKKDFTETLSPTVAPNDASNKNVTWESSNPAVATVDGGIVTAVGGGTATITVTTVDGGKFATCVVTVTVPVSGVSLDKTSLALDKDGSDTLTATVAPGDADNKNVIWSTSDAGVATVSTGGLVTAVGGGTATITAKTSDGGFEASCFVTVTVPVTGVTLDKGTLTLEKDANATLTATVAPNDATNKNVSWESSDETMATVDDNGVVTAVGKGTATITVSADGGKFTATCLVTVTVPVTGVTLDKGTLTLEKDANATLTATVAPGDADNKNVTWSTSSAAVATVSNTGLVEAIGGGSATITVSADGGKFTATCLVTVTVPVTGVSLDKETLTLVKGTTGNLTATVAPNDASNKNVTWTSSDEAVATVANGVVTAVGGGTATITVTTEDGSKIATCVVTVTIDISFTIDYDRPGNILTPSTGEVTIQQGGTITISAPDEYAGYEWYIDGKVVNGATGYKYVFDSTGRAAGKYNIGLKITDAGKIINGDTITVNVTK